MLSLRCLQTPYILPGSPAPPPPSPTLPGPGTLAHLDDAAPPGGRPRRLQEDGLGISRSPSSARQHDPAATVPRPAPRRRRSAVPGAGVRARSGVVFARGRVWRRGTLPAGRALSHGPERFGLSAGRLHAPRRGSAAGHGRAPAPGGGPAALCFTARGRRRRQLSGAET